MAEEAAAWRVLQEIWRAWRVQSKDFDDRLLYAHFRHKILRGSNIIVSSCPVRDYSSRTWSR